MMTTLVVVSDGVNFWFALQFSYHLHGIRNARAGVRIVKKNLRTTHHYIQARDIGWNDTSKLCEKTLLVPVEEDIRADEAAVLLDDVPDAGLVGELCAVLLEVDDDLGPLADAVGRADGEGAGAVRLPVEGGF